VFGVSAALAMSLAGTVATTVSAAAHDADDDRPYLALGDSVSFGFIAQAGFEYVNADNFVGYPAYAGRTLELDPVEASCPGETTGSFLSSRAADNGCRPIAARRRSTSRMRPLRWRSRPPFSGSIETRGW
jgi:hypothetical protein